MKTARSAFRLSKNNILIEPVGGGSPESIVEHAIRRVTEIGLGPREDQLDEAWVVFDAEVTPHSRAREAVDLARGANLQSAVCNPSFELWLLLHAGEENRHLTARQAKRKCEQELAIPGPSRSPASFDDSRLHGTWETAATRAAGRRNQIRADERADELSNDVVVVLLNPATNLDDLVRAVVEARGGASSA